MMPCVGGAETGVPGSPAMRDEMSLSAVIEIPLKSWRGSEPPPPKPSPENFGDDLGVGSGSGALYIGHLLSAI